MTQNYVGLNLFHTLIIMMMTSVSDYEHDDDGDDGDDGDGGGGERVSDFEETQSRQFLEARSDLIR